MWSKLAINAYVAREALRAAQAGHPHQRDPPRARPTRRWPRPTPTRGSAFGADYRDEVGIEASTPLEQAYPLVFLCSDAAAGITGITLVTDAGYFASGHQRVVPEPAERRRRVLPQRVLSRAGCARSPSSPRPTSGSGPRAPTAACASRAATTASALVHPPVPICPVVPQPVVDADRGVGPGDGRRLHGQPPPVAARLRAAVRDRQRRPRRGPERPPHHEHRRLRARRRPHRPGGRGPLRAARRRVAPAVRADRRRPTPSTASPSRSGPTPRPPLSDDRFEHRSVLSGVGRSAIGPPADGRPAVAHGRRLPRGRRRRRAHARRHRRPVDLPGPGRDGHERGRRHRGRGGAAAPPDVDQRRRRAARARAARSSPRCSRWPSGLCRHVLCFRTVWESTYAALRPAPAAAAAGSSAPMQEWRLPFGAMSAANWIGMNANQYLHRYGATREMLGWIALNGRANAGRNPAAIYRDPMTMDDYLSARPITHARSASTTATCPCDASIAVDRVRRRRSPPTCPKPADPDRGGRHPDHRAHLVGPGHGHPRAAGARPVGPPVDPHEPAPGRRRPRPALRRLHVQRHLVARGASASAGSARPRTGSTAAAASRSTASCR